MHSIGGWKIFIIIDMVRKPSFCCTVDFGVSARVGALIFTLVSMDLISCQSLLFVLYRAEKYFILVVMNMRVRSIG